SRRRIRARRHARAAADARRRVHGFLGDGLWDWDGVGVGRRAGVDRNVAARGHDAVKGRAVHHQVLDDGERVGPEGLHRDGAAGLEVAHAQLARGGLQTRTMGLAVDGQAAHAANALAAVAFEGDFLFAVFDQLLVELV